MTWRRLVILAVGVTLVLGAAVFFWARAVLAGDAVRRTVEAQLARALGQPVSIGRASATILPRVTMALHDVAIGDPARITIARLDVGTDVRALLSRRIEHATVRLAGARLDLPLPPLAIGPAGGDTTSADPVEIVSVDSIILDDVEITGGGRVLRADVEVAPAGRGLDVRHVALEAAGTTLTLTGTIADLAGPTGELTVSAASLDVPALVDVVSRFAAELDAGAPETPPAADPVPMDLRIAIEADRASLGALAIERVSGQARLTPAEATLSPVTFGVFGGGYRGTLAFTLAETPAFRMEASLSAIDMAEVMAFASAGDAITGRLSGTIDVTGRGTSADRVLTTARGTARIEIVDGTIANLGLVRTVVLAGSMREDSQAAARVGATRTEPFDSLSATFAIGNGVARTEDLRFQSADVQLTGAGALALAARSVTLIGRVQLSEALSAQAGRDLLRLTRENGRVTVPVVITGQAGDLSVSLDVSEAARRALLNTATDEAKKALSRALGRIIR